MTDAPWQGDAVSLVDAFRAGERSPAEELEATLAAIEASELRCFSFVDPEGARALAASADVNLPFGGVPFGIKELESVAGWPDTSASVVFKDRVGEYESTRLQRSRAAGLVPVGLTTASEFGGLNVSVTKLNGITGNPWDPSKTAGGSSGGSASAVAGGLVTIASGGDGGGSIRIPAAFNGLLGMKGTAGRIPRGPHTAIAPMTVVTGCLARSVRDVARYYDVCAGYDAYDPYSLPKIEGWERDLGTHDLAGKKVAIVPDLGAAVLRPEVEASVRAAAEALVKDAGLQLVDLQIDLPRAGAAWAMANTASLVNELGDRWPACRDDLTKPIAVQMEMASEVFDLAMAAKGEARRTQINDAMATVFEQVDLVICATNPDVAFPAHVGVNTRVGDQKVGIDNNGRLTVPTNLTGNPAISIPVEQVDGLPVGMQVVGRHHEDALLFDLALLVEHERPWPLTAPVP
jgi:aspartyl-tRNA(Asn)/glutamyl-tRNA(Gln) amidotransferase subunit A